MYSTSISRIFLEHVGVISIFSSCGTLSCRQNLVINNGNKREVWHCLVLMAISFSMMKIKFSLFLVIIHPRKTSFGWRMIELFCDNMIMILTNPKQYLKTTLRPLFFMDATTSIHIRMLSKRGGANQPFASSMVFSAPYSGSHA